MAPKKRLTEIDTVRGIAIIVMILIHTNAYFLSHKVAFAAVELSQFAVVAFIFCSAYLYYLKEPAALSLRDFAVHLWKRIKRLVIPYYLYLATYTFFLFLSNPKKLTVNYFVNNLTLTGGIDFNWLVLLFIEMAILMPTLSLLRRRLRPAYYLYLILALISSLVFLLNTPLSWYRAIMWLPWSLVLIYTLHADAIWQNKRLFALVTLALFAIFAVSQQFVLVPFHHSLRMYDNKYPPNIYHLAYSLFTFNIIYLLSKIGVFRTAEKLIHFYSFHSYSIYFIHLLVIYAVTVFMKIKFTWVTFFLVVIGITTVIQLIANAINAFLRYREGRQSEYLPAPSR